VILRFTLDFISSFQRIVMNSTVLIIEIVIANDCIRQSFSIISDSLYNKCNCTIVQLLCNLYNKLFHILYTDQFQEGIV